MILQCNSNNRQKVFWVKFRIKCQITTKMLTFDGLIGYIVDPSCNKAKHMVKKALNYLFHCSRKAQIQKTNLRTKVFIHFVLKKFHHSLMPFGVQSITLIDKEYAYKF